MRHAARQAGRDIIDLGMGNPDLPPPQPVIDKLCEVASKPDAHGYSQSKGIPGLRRAQANYYGRRFGVQLDPESEVVVITGYPTIEAAKEAVRLGAQNYIAKPVGPTEVIKAANDAINHKRWALHSERRNREPAGTAAEKY